MNIFGIFAIILGIYYLGLSNGLLFADRASRVRGIGAVILSPVLAVALWQAAQNSTTASAGVIAIVLLGVLALVFISGFGLLIGSLTALLPAASKSKHAIGKAVTIIPAALMAWGVYAYETNRIAGEKAQDAALAAFQDRTLTGSFGLHSISLPVVPSLQIVHACKEGTRACHTHFWSSTELNQASPDTFELHAIELRLHDRNTQELNNWCNHRPAMLDTIWCTEQWEHRSLLRLKEEPRPHNPKNGTIYPAPDGIGSLICQQHWNGLICEAKFDVAEGIEGYVATRDMTPQEAAQEALITRQRLARIWTALVDDVQK